MTPTERLKMIAVIIETVDQRCAAADGPVTATNREITQWEISKIYRLAKLGRHNVKWNPNKAISK